MTRNGRARLASFDPTKLGETDLQLITERMHAVMRQGGQKYPTKMGRAGAIRRKCIDCCGGDRSEVRRCEATDCPLWPHRLGGDPYRRRPKKKDPGAAATAQGLPTSPPNAIKEKE